MAPVGWVAPGGRAECHGLAVLGSYLWNAQAHRVNTSLEWLGRLMPIAHQSRVNCVSAQVSKLCQITGPFSLYCCCNQLLWPALNKSISASVIPSRRPKLTMLAISMVAYLLLCVAVFQQQINQIRRQSSNSQNTRFSHSSFEIIIP